MKNNLCRFKQN